MSKIPDGWHDVQNNYTVLTTTTEYGLMAYSFEKTSIENLFGELAFSFLANLAGLPTTVEEVEEMTGVNQSKILDIEIDIDSDEIPKEVELIVEKSIEYFKANAALMFSEAIRNFITESFTKSLLERAGEGHFKFNATENEIFKQLVKDLVANTKERIKVKKATGENSYWDPQKRAKLLELYEKLSPLTGKAKKSYRKLKGVKSSQYRQQIVKEQYPELPDEIIEQLSLTGMKISPKQILLEYLSTLFDNSSVNYLPEVVRKAKDERNKNK